MDKKGKHAERERERAWEEEFKEREAWSYSPCE